MVKRSEEFIKAVKTGDLVTAIEMLDQNPRLANLRVPEGISVIMMASYYAEHDMINLLLERGAILDIFDAAALGCCDQLRTLLEADPTQLNLLARDGFSPLALAAFFGRLDTVAILLERGAEINITSDNDRQSTPLHLAIAGEYLEVAHLLLDHGADPNARQEDDSTPLHEAAQTGQVEMIKLLLAHGADPTLENVQARTPGALAQEMGYLEAADLLNQE